MHGSAHGPDELQDLKRIIAAMNGKAKRITVIMPMLYEGSNIRGLQKSLIAPLHCRAHHGVENIIS